VVDAAWSDGCSPSTTGRLGDGASVERRSGVPADVVVSDVDAEVGTYGPDPRTHGN